MVKDISKEDAGLLRFAGFLGHEFVGVSGKPGERCVRAETSSLEGAKRLTEGDEHRTVYRKVSGKWKLVWSE